MVSGGFILYSPTRLCEAMLQQKRFLGMGRNWRWRRTAKFCLQAKEFVLTFFCADLLCWSCLPASKFDIDSLAAEDRKYFQLQMSDLAKKRGKFFSIFLSVGKCHFRTSTILGKKSRTWFPSLPHSFPFKKLMRFWTQGVKKAGENKRMLQSSRLLHRRVILKRTISQRHAGSLLFLLRWS